MLNSVKKLIKKSYYINFKKAAKKIRSRSHILPELENLMLVVSVTFMDKTFFQMLFLEKATNINSLLRIDKISNTDPQPKKEQLNTSISTCIFLLQGLVNFAVSLMLVRQL